MKEKNMPQFDFYEASIPAFVRGLNNLSAILAKGEAFAVAKKIEPAVLVQSRLAADMFPLARQVQIATDAVKGAAARLAGVDVPSFPDTETTFADLQERVAKTLKFIQGVDKAAVAASTEKHISLKVGPNQLEFSAPDYLRFFVLPNFYFHLTTTYDILRHNGVELGKADFLGQI